MALCSYLSISSKETTTCFPPPSFFILFTRQILRGASNINYLTSAFRRVWSRRGGGVHFGAACRWGSAQGVWIIGEPKWFRLEDSFLLWGCGTFVSPLHLVAEVDSGRSFKLAGLCYYRKGCCWCWSSSVCGVRCGSLRASVRLGPIVLIFVQVPFMWQWPQRPSPLGQMAVVDGGSTGIVVMVVLVGSFSFFGWGWDSLRWTHVDKKHDWVSVMCNPLHVRCPAPQS